MSIDSAKNITRRSWDTIMMPDTAIDHVNEIAYNEQNQFILTDHRGCPIGDVDIT